MKNHREQHNIQTRQELRPEVRQKEKAGQKEKGAIRKREIKASYGILCREHTIAMANNILPFLAWTTLWTLLMLHKNKSVTNN